MTTTGASAGGVAGEVTTAAVTGEAIGPVRVRVRLPIAPYICSCISSSTFSSLRVQSCQSCLQDSN